MATGEPGLRPGNRGTDGSAELMVGTWGKKWADEIEASLGPAGRGSRGGIEEPLREEKRGPHWQRSMDPSVGSKDPAGLSNFRAEVSVGVRTVVLEGEGTHDLEVVVHWGQRVRETLCLEMGG